MTKLYTAAEARRIDIERGGGGFIINEYSKRTYYHDDNDLIWRQKGTDSVENGAAIIKPCWFPLTPAPEAEKEDGELNLESLLRRKCDEIEQLEKELAELKENKGWTHCRDANAENDDTVVFRHDRDGIVGMGRFWEMKQSWVLHHKNSSIELPDDYVNHLSWKYEADL